MTKEDMEREIGSAFIERKILEREIACLEGRLRSFSNACVTLISNPVHGQSLAVVEGSGDPREDWAELKKCLIRYDELGAMLK